MPTGDLTQDSPSPSPSRRNGVRSGDVRFMFIATPLALSPLVIAALLGLMSPQTSAELGALVGAAAGSLLLAIVLCSLHLGLVGAMSKRDRAEAATRIDAATGLLDRTALMRHLEKWTKAGQRDGTGLALLCVDLGELRERVRAQGIVGGDQRVAKLAGRLRTLVRRTRDEVFLLDTERVVILLSDIEPAAAHAVAWRLVQHLRAEGNRFGTRPGTQAAVGIAFRRTADSPGAWLTRAIHAMDLARVTRGGARDADPSIEILPLTA